MELNPPNPIVAGGAATKFEFRKTLDNSEISFIGFELYYRMYRAGDAANPNIITFEDLLLNGFRRVNASTDEKVAIDKPLIKIHIDDRTPPPPPATPTPTNDEFVISIDFGTDALSVDPPLPQISDDDSPDITGNIDIQDIRRGVFYVRVGQEEQFKRFSEFNENDDDINSDIWADITVPIEIKIVMYVVSYGLDVVLNKKLYSTPEYLGEINRIFPYDLSS